MAEVETSREGAVLTVTLNRPDVLNALNAATHKALVAALKDARAADVRAVVLTGAGRGFCVGQDLTEFRDAPADVPDRLRAHHHPNLPGLRPAARAGCGRTAPRAPAPAAPSTSRSSPPSTGPRPAPASRSRARATC